MYGLPHLPDAQGSPREDTFWTQLQKLFDVTQHDIKAVNSQLKKDLSRQDMQFFRHLSAWAATIGVQPSWKVIMFTRDYYLRRITRVELCAKVLTLRTKETFE